MAEKKLSKREQDKQDRYYGLMLKNAKVFSTRMIQKLGLTDEGPNDDNTLIIEDALYDDNTVIPFMFDGYKYITFDEADRILAQSDSLPFNIKTFDPYNDIRLCMACVGWYLQTVLNVNPDIINVLAVTNQKMNDEGYALIKFSDMRELRGHPYNRDCLKYLDLIYIMDQSLSMEYTELSGLDMVSFEDFK